MTRRMGLALVTFLVVAAAASVLLQLYYRQDRLWVGIWWVEGTTDRSRMAAERSLSLIPRDVKRDRWTYRLQNYSSDAVGAVVDHPLVRLTQNIDRRTLRVHIDAPALPIVVRRMLESGTGFIVSATAAVISLVFVAVWWRQLKAALPGSPGTWASCAVVTLLLFVYAVEIARTAWMSDDAAITLRTVLNSINGYGARFNIDERVQAYTHPLWFLLITVVSYVSNNVFAATLWLSVASSLAALWVLLRSRASLLNAVVVTAGLLLSKAYVDYSAPGLENPLSHLVALCTAIAAIRYCDDGDQRHFRIACIGLGAAYLTRPDLILIVAPLMLYAILRRRPSRRALTIGVLLAAVPIAAWSAIALYYYGSPLPNPAYAKLGAGLPIVDRWMQGGRYFMHSVPRDTITLVLIGLGIAIGVTDTGVNAALACGVVIYLLYVAGIGGDFMEGRFFSTPVLLSALVLIRQRQSALRLAVIGMAVTVLGAANLHKTILSSANYNDPVIPPDGITDERGYYFPDYGWLNAGGEVFDAREWKIDPEDLNDVQVECGGLGFDSIMDGPAVHYVDACGLADPLLARLPAKTGLRFRVGHFERAVPPGYVESVRTRTNRLVDPALYGFYESIRLITRGDLADWRRLREIVRFNIGMLARREPAVSHRNDTAGQRN